MREAKLNEFNALDRLTASAYSCAALVSLSYRLIFEDEIRMTLKNQTPRVIKIKAMRKTKPEISQEKYQETPF